MPVIPLRRLKQVNCKFMASLDNLLRPYLKIKFKTVVRNVAQLFSLVKKKKKNKNP